MRFDWNPCLGLVYLYCVPRLQVMTVTQGRDQDRIKAEILAKLIRLFFLAAKTQRLNEVPPDDNIAFSDRESGR